MTSCQICSHLGDVQDIKMNNKIEKGYPAVYTDDLCQPTSGIFYQCQKNKCRPYGSAEKKQGRRILLYIHKRKESCHSIFLFAPMARIAINICCPQSHKK